MRKTIFLIILLALTAITLQAQTIKNSSIAVQPTLDNTVPFSFNPIFRYDTTNFILYVWDDGQWKVLADGSGGGGSPVTSLTADSVTYDPSGSILVSEDVQGAIDELALNQGILDSYYAALKCDSTTIAQAADTTYTVFTCYKSGSIVQRDTVWSKLGTVGGTQDATEVALNPTIDVDGDLSNETTVQEAIEDMNTVNVLDRANLSDLTTAVGIAPTEQDLGTFTGSTITDNSTVKEAIQELETGLESVSGGADGDGIYDGPTGKHVPAGTRAVTPDSAGIVWYADELELKAPVQTHIKSYLNMNSNRIGGVGDPVSGTDAVNLQTLQAYSGGGATDTNFLRTTLPKSGNNTRGYYALPLDFSFDTISNYANTLLDIQYNYDAGGDTITMPEGVTLRGDGGVISNAVVVLDGTDLIGDREVFGSNVTLQGTVRRKEVNLKHIGYNPDSLEVLFSRALAVLPAGGHITVPADDYLLNGPIHVTTSNTHIVFEEGNTVAVNDTGNWPNLFIDTTKAGMPLLKTSIQFDSVQDCSLRGLNLDSQGMLHDGAVSPQEGQAGVHVRKGLRVTISDCSIVNVFPSFFGETYGGFGDQRYTGILVTQSRDCTVSGNHVYRCKYDGIGIRMQNYDILVEGNIIGSCAEGIQSSDRYATVVPREDNMRTNIVGNRIYEVHSQGIVFHCQQAIIQNNIIASFRERPGANQWGVRAIECTGTIFRDNIVVGNNNRGIEDGALLSTDSIETLGIIAYSIADDGSVLFQGNQAYEVDLAIEEVSQLFGPQYFSNTFVRVNHGYQTTVSNTKLRNASWINNRISAFQTGLELKDKGTIIRDNYISEVDGFGGATTGIDLDPEGDNDTRYLVSGTLPLNFTNAFNASTNNRTVFAPDMFDDNDTYYNTGTITITTGNTEGVDSHNFITAPLPGEIQVIQLRNGADAVPFLVDSGTTNVRVTISSPATEDLEFQWVAALRGYSR